MDIFTRGYDSGFKLINGFDYVATNTRVSLTSQDLARSHFRKICHYLLLETQYLSSLLCHVTQRLILAIA